MKNGAIGQDFWQSTLWWSSVHVARSGHAGHSFSRRAHH